MCTVASENKSHSDLYRFLWDVDSTNHQLRFSHFFPSVFSSHALVVYTVCCWSFTLLTCSFPALSGRVAIMGVTALLPSPSLFVFPGRLPVNAVETTHYSCSTTGMWWDYGNRGQSWTQKKSSYSEEEKERQRRSRAKEHGVLCNTSLIVCHGIKVGT